MDWLNVLCNQMGFVQTLMSYNYSDVLLSSPSRFEKDRIITDMLIDWNINYPITIGRS